MTRCSIYLLFLWQHPILSLVTIWFDICFIAAVSVEAPMLGWIIQLGVTVLFTVFHICLFAAWNYWNIKRFKSRYQVYYISGATSRQIVNYVMFKFNFSIIIALLFWIIVRKYNTDFIYGKYRISVTGFLISIVMLFVIHQMIKFATYYLVKKTHLLWKGGNLNGIY